MTAPDLRDLRDRFPALRELGPGGQPFAFFDGPAGTHVPQSVIDAYPRYFTHANANTHGNFETSRRSQEVVDGARSAMADFLNAVPGEIAFGPNMTTLTFALSRALGRTWKAGDEVIVTALDHDANVAPWRALEERGIVVRECGFHVEDCTLDLEQMWSLINERTQLVAVGHACNSVGTVNPIQLIAERAHAVGAKVWVDAVHSAPHRSIDVQVLGIDYLVCSAYKFFGPHAGIFWARREHLDALSPYKVRPSPARAPDKFETGTLAFEALAATTAAVDYLASIGRRPDTVGAPPGRASGRRRDLECAFATIRAWEQPMARRVIEGLEAIPGTTVFGITDPARLDERCPTVSFRLAGVAPDESTRRLDELGICLWDGNQYALGVTQGLGIEKSGGLVRIGIVHYNTPEEVERFLEAVESVARRSATAGAES